MTYMYIAQRVEWLTMIYIKSYGEDVIYVHFINAWLSIESLLVQVIGSHVFGVEPLPIPMLIYNHLDP